MPTAPAKADFVTDWIAHLGDGAAGKSIAPLIQAATSSGKLDEEKLFRALRERQGDVLKKIEAADKGDADSTDTDSDAKA
jgi:hypothetical protein